MAELNSKIKETTIHKLFFPGDTTVSRLVSAAEQKALLLAFISPNSN